MESGEPFVSDKLTKQILKSLSNEFDIESIHTLSLNDQGFQDISVIGQYSSFLFMLCVLFLCREEGKAIMLVDSSIVRLFVNNRFEMDDGRFERLSVQWMIL